MCNLTRGLTLLALLSFTSPAHGQTWVERPNTDHWYTRATDSHDLAWHQSNATSLGAHLAIFETLEENVWVTSANGVTGGPDWAWIGLWQDSNDPDYSEDGFGGDNGGWKWTDGTAVTYTNWNPDHSEPNGGIFQNYGLSDHSLHASEWADARHFDQYEGIYEVQSGDCDSNGLPDVVEVATASATDTNGNGIIDACETVLTGLTWTHRPGTDSWYAITGQYPWDFGRTMASNVGADLAVISDSSEEQWVIAYNFANGDQISWIGLYQDHSSPTFAEPGGGWKWTNPSNNYNTWAPGEPNDWASGEDHGSIRGNGITGINDSLPLDRPCILELQSPDCDGNGVPDTYEILLTPSLDADSNGTLDVCQPLDLNWVMRPGTVHWYTRFEHSQPWAWHRDVSNGLGAHLVILETLEESVWVTDPLTLGGGNGFWAWIGLYQDLNNPSFSEPAGGWKWINGKPLSFNNWVFEDPNNLGAAGDSPANHGVCNHLSSGSKLADELGNHSREAIYEIISSDCDENGVPDTYEIVLTPNLDVDLNGWLDSCGPMNWEEDCNGNGISDFVDIVTDSTDWNADGRPDECTPFTSILREHEGALENPAFTLAFTDDLDGDSIDDYLIAEPAFDLPNAANTGRVCLRSGIDGSLIQEWVSNNNPSYTDLALGFSLDASGDWDGDGTNDILIGAPGYSGVQTGGTLTENGAAFIYSGANPGQLIEALYGIQNEQRLGYAVCFLDDSTGDGRTEYATSSPFFTNIFGGLGQVTVYEGGTDNVLYNYSGNPGDLYGAKLASGADVDGDGYDDLLIGAPGDDTQGPGTLQDGRVIVVSGKTGSEIAEVLPVANWSSFTGASLAMLDDLNADGRAEFVVGSPRYDLLNGSATRAGKISVYQYSPGSSGNVDLLFDMKGTETNDTLGVALTRTGDLNGDSISEFAVGVPGVRAPMQPASMAEDVGKVIVIDPVNQRVIREIYGREVGDRFGYVLASGEGDLNGDGPMDLIAGNRSSLGSEAAYAWVCSDTMELLGSYYCEPNEEHDADDDGALETGLRALISIAGTTDLSAPGGSLTLRCDFMPTGQFGIFFYGTNPIQASFGPVGGWRCVGGGVSRLPILNSGSDGQMVLEIDYAGTTTGFNPAELAGKTRHFQCWFRDAPGQSGHFNLSDAVTLTFQ